METVKYIINQINITNNINSINHKLLFKNLIENKKDFELIKFITDWYQIS